jgi:hypothetical protein
MRVHKASLALAALIAAPIALETAVALPPGPSGAPTDLNEPNDSVVWVDGRTRKQARQNSSTGEQSEFFVSGRRSAYRVNPDGGLNRRFDRTEPSHSPVPQPPSFAREMLGSPPMGNRGMRGGMGGNRLNGGMRRR